MRKLVYFLGLLMLLLCQVMQAQELTGTILKDGKPQKNIRVWLKHNKGVVKTDKEGHFWLPLVHPSDTLVMGVSTKYDAQLLVGEHKDIIINLEDEGFTVSGGLEEVTVTAPSTMRNTYTSVITLKRMQKVTHDVIMREHVKTVLDAIRRIVPGARYVEDPLSHEKIISIVRGPISLRNQLGQPLFVIDGIPYETGVEVDNVLSMDDVAELTVDRDGSGYGARGANGVVIIRTMRGSDK